MQTKTTHRRGRSTKTTTAIATMAAAAGITQGRGRQNENASGLNVIGLVLLGCTLFWCASAAQGATADLWTESGLCADLGTGTDSFAPGTTLYAEQQIQGQVQVSSGILGGASISITPPQPVQIVDYDSQPQPYFHWIAGTGIWTATGPMDSSSQQLSGSLKPRVTVPFAPTIGVSRSISSPVLGSDTEIRTVTMTLTVPSGGLAGYNNMNLNMVNNWNLPQGLSITGFSNMTNDAEFGADTSWGGFYNGLTAVSGLSGTYTFSADVTFQRSGALSELSYGDMFLKPGGQVSYSQSSWGVQTGPSVSQTVGGSIITASANGSTTWNYNANVEARRIGFNTVVAAQNGAVSVSEIDLMKQKRSAFNGNLSYSFNLSITAANVVSGTVTTPDNKVYDLQSDPDDWTGLEIYAASDSYLQAMGFIDGTYTITLVDAQGNQTVKTVSLSGGFPGQDPTLNQTPLDTTNRRPTIFWSAPDTSIDAVNFEVSDDQGFEQQKLLMKKTDDLQGDTSWTPTADMEYGGYYLSAMFFNGHLDTVEGLTTIQGYVSSTDSYMNVIPEPATLSLLALGGLALIRRRKP